MLNAKRVGTVHAEPVRWIKAFDGRRKPFGGPSEYFHEKAIARLRHLGLRRALKDRLVLEYVYATLTAWGLHRMGDTRAKLVDFDAFCRTIADNGRGILKLRNRTIFQAATDPSIVEDLASLLEGIKVGVGDKRIVYSSKALHHFLPDLIPPIDNQYTFRFFYGRTQVTAADRRFREIYRGFVAIANGRCSVLAKWASRGHGFHTSVTKEIDNAIVGYVLKHSTKRSRRRPARA